MSTFSQKYGLFLLEFGKGKKMVLSTSENSRVSSRMMSVVQIDGMFYFQTDITFKKYHQIVSNHNVALCIDNIQIEGICEEIGHPLQFAPFCNIFQECFKGSYDAYTSLQNERLFSIKPMYIERWVYEDGVPYLETFDIKTQEYKSSRYIGT
ncbi:MAG: pyridoxamine 5'-phosphate oxidase family protein [Ruminiclostridium sp.]|nr:pyridoxamine 5'-phosphate oxidase family protein [Ruminiclostridium sp.]